MTVLRIAVKAVDMNSGDLLEVWGDCPTLERDMSAWCERLGRGRRVAVSDIGDGERRIRIQF
jgi:TusA-related sulfurtransferase